MLCARSRIELEHLVAPLGIHAVRGLVEKQQIGIVDERLRQLDALLHARRVRLDVAVPRLAEADVVQHLVRALHRVGLRQPRELAAVGDERHGVHAGNVPVVLRHVAEPRAHLERPLRDVKPEHLELARRGRNEAEQRLEHRALAGAVRARAGRPRPWETRTLTSRSAAFLPYDDADVVEDDGKLGHDIGRLTVTDCDTRYAVRPDRVR